MPPQVFRSSAPHVFQEWIYARTGTKLVKKEDLHEAYVSYDFFGW